MLAAIELAADGQQQAIRMATGEEIEADETVSRLVENSPDERWMVLRPEQTLAADANIYITIGPGAPSAEGPMVTKDHQNFYFQTYAPLRIEEHRCGWSLDSCLPLTPFSIDFNNPIDPDTFDASMLGISPELPGATVEIIGRTIRIRGSSQGQTDYEVTVDKELQDIFGQTLGKEESLTFKVGSARPLLTGPEESLITLDPSSDKPIFTVYSINHNNLRLRAYAVGPEDWPAYQLYLRNRNREDQQVELPGREVLNK
jgi:hypothetical protein